MKTKHLLLTAFVALCSYYAQADCRVDTIYYYKLTPPDTILKEKTDRTINTYDANNNQTQYLYQTWDAGSNSWKNRSKYDRTFDANNNITQDLNQTWDTSSNVWKNNYKYDITFDANNNKTQELFQKWDVGSNSWENNSKKDYTSDANNNQTQELSQTWDGGSNVWKNKSKYGWTFDANNNQTQQLSQVWDTVGNIWVNNTKYDNTYNSNNKLVQTLKQTWDTGSNLWKDNTKTDYAYDANNKQTQRFVQFWDAANNSWKNYSKNDWTYDANGCKLSEDYYDSWNESGSYYANHTRNEYFNTHLENTGITALNTSGLKIYPNPVNDQLTIKTENELSNATATVMDLFGRVVLQEKLNTQQTIINTSTLNSGVYFLQINADGKRIVKKFVKE